MALIGWAEVAFGGLGGLVLVFAALGAGDGQPGGTNSPELRFLVIQAAGSVVIGVLTLVAARSFRRAGQDPAAGLPGVTTAVANLAELYERQVWLAGLLLVLGVDAALARCW